jgi:hypothetical protein
MAALKGQIHRRRRRHHGDPGGGGYLGLLRHVHC